MSLFFGSPLCFANDTFRVYQVGGCTQFISTTGLNDFNQALRKNLELYQYLNGELLESPEEYFFIVGSLADRHGHMEQEIKALLSIETEVSGPWFGELSGTSEKGILEANGFAGIHKEVPRYKATSHVKNLESFVQHYPELNLLFHPKAEFHHYEDRPVHLTPELDDLFRFRHNIDSKPLTLNKWHHDLLNEEYFSKTGFTWEEAVEEMNIKITQLQKIFDTLIKFNTPIEGMKEMRDFLDQLIVTDKTVDQYRENHLFREAQLVTLDEKISKIRKQFLKPTEAVMVLRVKKKGF